VVVSLSQFVGCVMLIVLTKMNLAELIKESRAFYAKLGWAIKGWAVGIDGELVRLAGDDFALDYTFLENGRVSVCASGAVPKVAEFIRTDLQRYVDLHNHGETVGV